jgi:hypothetical protein
MGNCTASIKRVFSEGPLKAVIADVSLSSSYATGGDTLPLSALGMNTVEAVNLCGGQGGRLLEVVHGATDVTAPKIKAYRDVTPAATAPLPEETAATNLTTTTVRVIAYGDGPF